MMAALLAEVWPYILGAVAALAAFFGIRQSGKEAGRREAQQEQAQANAQAKEKAREIDVEVDSLSADDLDRRDERWVRDRSKR